MSSKSYSLRIAEILAINHLHDMKHAKSRYVLTNGNFIACAQCCHIFRERFATLENWIIKTDCVNKNNRYLKCGVCDNKIISKNIAR